MAPSFLYDGRYLCHPCRVFIIKIIIITQGIQLLLIILLIGSLLANQANLYYWRCTSCATCQPHMWTFMTLRLHAHAVRIAKCRVSVFSPTQPQGRMQLSGGEHSQHHQHRIRTTRPQKRLWGSRSASIHLNCTK